MQFLTSLIGGSGNMYLNAGLALGVVLVLVVLALWALKLVMRASDNVVRGAKKRLAVIDAIPVDGKRQLLIIRRDNVEHLIMTGGPQDLVVETGIAVESAPRPVPAVRRSAPAVPQVAQRPPLPQRANTAGAAPVLPVANDETPGASSLEHLRELGRNANAERRAPSLRHTGLLRPVSRVEPPPFAANADNSAQFEPDSATTARVMPFGAPRDGNGQAFGGESNSGEHRDDGY